MGRLIGAAGRWRRRLGAWVAGAAPHEADPADAQFRRLAEESLQGILVHDGTRRLFANPAYARMFGYRDVAAVLAAETVGQDIVPPEDLPALAAEWRRILAGQQQIVSHRRCRRRRL